MVASEPQGRILRLAGVDSTQDEARRRWQAGETDLGGVRADWQSMGRGRRGDGWVAEAGKNLLITLLMPTASDRPPAHDAAAAAVAVARAVIELARLDVRIKWPNDLVSPGGKLAGVLVERIVAAERSVALVGVGLNVNAEPEGVIGAASLRAETGRNWDVSAVEGHLRAQLRLAWDDSLPRLLAWWRVHDATVGQRYTLGDGVVGVATGVGSDGALTLALPGGEVRSVWTARALG